MYPSGKEKLSTDKHGWTRILKEIQNRLFPNQILICVYLCLSVDNFSALFHRR